MAGVLDPRLFADFNANACVIIKKRPFVERLTYLARFVLRGVKMEFGAVDYVDPLGAFSSGNRLTTVTSIPLYMTKLFRYAYQNEIRFVCIPNHPEENLKPAIIEIGSISDIAELIALN